MKTKRLHMIGHAHIDPVWLWTWQEGFHEVKATFRSALDRMKEDPDFTFAASSAAFYEWVEQSDPGMFAEISERAAEERWDIVGGWWVEPDCNIPCGESFARHSLYGQGYFQAKFGRKAKTGFNVDSFGHAGTLPQILKKSGIEGYTFLRPMPHEMQLPARLFWWEAAEGSRVLAFEIPFAYLSWGADLAEHALACANEIPPGQDEILCFYGVGNHGGGPTRENLESLHRLDADPAFPARLACSTPEAFFASALEKGWDIPVARKELQHHARGCYSVHSGIKRWNRQAENRLMAAEKWSFAAACALDLPYPADFAQAWKQVLFNQFHDILAGTSLEEAYDDARVGFGEALSIAGRNLNAAQQAFAWNVRIPEEEGCRPLLAFNPLTWPVRANLEIESSAWPEGSVLVDETGKQVPYQSVQSASAAGRKRLSFNADLPALGYRTYRLLEGGAAGEEFPAAEVGDTFIQTERFRLELNPADGTIAQLLDRKRQVEVFRGPAAHGVVLDDPADTWAHDVARWDNEIGSFGMASVHLAEHGPVKSVLRAVSRWGASTLVQDFTLYPGGAWIDVRVTVDWHESYKMLKLRFPVNLEGARVTREIPYGHADILPDGVEQPFQQWVDVSDPAGLGGFSLINDGKYSLDVRGADIGLTVLRSPAYAHHIPSAPREGGFYSIIDQGRQTFHYRMLPHTGGWQAAGTARRAAELNQPAGLLWATFHPQGRLSQRASFIALDPETVMATVLKQAEDGLDLILRLVETGGLPARAQVRLPGWDRKFEAEMKAGEIKTLRIPRDPAREVIETNLLEEAG